MCNKPSPPPSLESSCPNKNPTCWRLSTAVQVTVGAFMPPSRIVNAPTSNSQSKQIISKLSKNYLPELWASSKFQALILLTSRKRSSNLFGWHCLPETWIHVEEWTDIVINPPSSSYKQLEQSTNGNSGQHRRSNRNVLLPELTGI